MTGFSSFKTPSHNCSGSRPPAFASSMIFRATASGGGSTPSVCRSATRAISKATPMRRVVSGSNLRPSKYAVIGMTVPCQVRITARLYNQPELHDASHDKAANRWALFESSVGL